MLAESVITLVFFKANRLLDFPGGLLQTIDHSNKLSLLSSNIHNTISQSDVHDNSISMACLDLDMVISRKVIKCFGKTRHPLAPRITIGKGCTVTQSLTDANKFCINGGLFIWRTPFIWRIPIFLGLFYLLHCIFASVVNVCRSKDDEILDKCRTF